jgi:hypothetical protein
MYKIMALVVLGTFLAASGLYLISVVGFPIIVFPAVNWAAVGFVMLVGSAVIFGTAFLATKFD